jgi:hypothetical protein
MTVAAACTTQVDATAKKKKITIFLAVNSPKQAVSIARNLVQEKTQWRKLLLKALQIFPVYAVDLRTMPITSVIVKHVGNWTPQKAWCKRCRDIQRESVASVLAKLPLYSSA